MLWKKSDYDYDCFCFLLKPRVPVMFRDPAAQLTCHRQVKTFEISTLSSEDSFKDIIRKTASFIFVFKLK